MINRPGVLVTPDTKGLNMANYTRFPLRPASNTMSPDSPETGVTLRTVYLVAFSARIICMTGAAVVDMTRFYQAPGCTIRKYHRIDPQTMSHFPFSGRLMI
jgi:hypothetical protein